VENIVYQCIYELISRACMNTTAKYVYFGQQLL